MESFHQYIESTIVKLAQKNITEAIVIMDNKHINQGPDIRKFIKSKGYRLMCLPPNSPFLNPIEGMYTKWKELVREKDPQNENELFQVMGAVFSEISESDCNSCFEYMLNYLPKCNRREEIFD
ncbi:hypothetical protein K502DRAFT_296032 [Neoconidiobolus thromboides FSU 785]|nr:hypothetical protein K502DRAFT_296032 [Neoconidiobolus thromboides FSU 785]